MLQHSQKHKITNTLCQSFVVQNPSRVTDSSLQNSQTYTDLQAVNIFSKFPLVLCWQMSSQASEGSYQEM